MWFVSVKMELNCKLHEVKDRTIFSWPNCGLHIWLTFSWIKC